MWGMIEFREDEHHHNIQSLRMVKKEVCDLLERMETDAHGERRGRYGNRMDERGRGMNNRMGERGGYANHFPYPESYPQYPMYDERYNY